MSHKTKISYLSQVGLIVTFLFTLLLLSCSAPEKRLEKERLTLVYRSQSTLGSEIKKLRLEHPIKISNEQIMNHLLLLHYEELTVLGGKKYIFSPREVAEIASLITKALNRMKANKILYYEVETPKGATAGNIFQARGKIHWRFETIKGMRFANSSFPGFRGSTWRLLPKHGQAYSKSKSLLGSEQQQNWIISSVNLPVKSKRSLSLRSSKKSPENTSRALKRKRPERSSTNQGEFEKRLQFLKNLRDKQLINDGEYEQKKTELLDQFF